jgi:hypothetical protein
MALRDDDLAPLGEKPGHGRAAAWAQAENRDPAVHGVSPFHLMQA